MTNEELIQTYRNDPCNTDTLRQLFVQNEGLIRKTASEVAHIYSAKQNEQVEDLISEGNLALLEVIVGNSYDPAKGKLITYALPFIRGAMCRGWKRISEPWQFLNTRWKRSAGYSRCTMSTTMMLVPLHGT